MLKFVPQDLCKKFRAALKSLRLSRGFGKAAGQSEPEKNTMRARQLKELKKLSSEDIPELEALLVAKNARKAELNEQLKEAVIYRFVTRTAPMRLLKQIHANEAVHEQCQVEDMIAQRMGEEANTNKLCFTRQPKIVGGKTDISNAIFISLHVVDLHDGMVLHQDLPGDIEDIKNRPVEQFDPSKVKPDQAVVAVFYSITTNPDYQKAESGGGRELVAAVHREMTNLAQKWGVNMVMTTLSPLRDYHRPDLTDELAWMDFTPEERAAETLKVLEFLLAADPRKNGVMNFHVGNGAYIGDIKFNPHNSKDPVMANYVYAPDQNELEAIRLRYAKGQGARTLSPHLYQVIQEQNPALLNASYIRLGRGGTGGITPFAAENRAFAPELGSQQDVSSQQREAHDLDLRPPASVAPVEASAPFFTRPNV